MNKDIKFNIISEGMKEGVSSTCHKYNISRTIYYRWLKRYKENGLDGLKDIKKEFIPVNKTKTAIEDKLFELIKTYPKYGPRAIKYLLEEIGIDISESAVFNVMKRHNLTNKENRIRFAHKKDSLNAISLLPIENLSSGECWVCWVTMYGYFESTGYIYEYNIIDVVSQIACTRLYDSLDFINFEDLLTAVAIPVAKSLKFNTHSLCFFKDNNIFKNHKKMQMLKIHSIFSESGFDITIQELDNYTDLTKINELKRQYNNGSTSHLMSLIKDGVSFNELKLQHQRHNRDYNITQKLMFNGDLLSPVGYHSKYTNSKPIFPLWAYVAREY